ncbi:MAG: hypothetical protein U0694_19025 [Anaerolineae bacterium]
MRNSRQTLIIAVLMLIAIIARALPGPRTIDDAFITFRYSRNIVEGQGFVYNPGVHTLGTTTPLFTLIMAGISAVTGGQDFQWYAIVVSALADAVTAALLFLLTQRATGSTLFGVIIGVLWGISPRSVTFAVGGMETSVNILWMVAAVWCYVSQQLPIPPPLSPPAENRGQLNGSPVSVTSIFGGSKILCVDGCLRGFGIADAHRLGVVDCAAVRVSVVGTGTWCRRGAARCAPTKRLLVWLFPAAHMAGLRADHCALVYLQHVLLWIACTEFHQR